MNDILIIRKRGLGKGKGFEEVSRYSLLDGSDPELLDLISDRVAVIYDMLYEDDEDDDEEDDVVVIEDDDSLSALDREILLAEREEEDEDEEDEEDEDDEIIL